MDGKDPWIAVQNELDEMLATEDYKPYRPLLEEVLPMINARYPDPEAARGVLVAVRQIHQARVSGENIREVVEDIKGGYIQEGWQVAGNVNNANRDVVNNTIITIVRNKADKLDLCEPNPRTYVPVVLLVMTDVEAKSLETETAFEGHPAFLKSDFRKLRKQLEKEKLIDWPQRYKPNAEDWQPFSSLPGSQTIRELITQTLDQLTINKPFNPPLAPDFKEIHLLVRNRLQLRRLRRNGCVVVIDAISLRHPKLQLACHQSLLDAYPRTSVVNIAPSNQAFEKTLQLSLVFQLQLADMEFDKRRVDISDPDDIYSCSVAYQPFELMQWLTGRVAKMNLPGAGGEPGIHPYMQVHKE